MEQKILSFEDVGCCYGKMVNTNEEDMVTKQKRHEGGNDFNKTEVMLR